MKNILSFATWATMLCSAVFLSACDSKKSNAGLDCSVHIASDPSTCSAIRVLILDDSESDSSGALLEPILDAAEWSAGVPMFETTNVGFRGDWDGMVTSTALSTDDFDVVFLLEGVDYSTNLSTEGAAALAAFVEAGGGLVRTEWGCAYNENQPGLSPANAYDGYDEDLDDKTWTLSSSSAPLADVLQDGLTNGFVTHHSIVDFEPKTAVETGDVAVIVVATVSSDSLTDLPGISYWPAVLTGDSPHGTIVHVNSDFAYLQDSTGGDVVMTEAPFKQMMQNVARAAASRL